MPVHNPGSLGGGGSDDQGYESTDATPAGEDGRELSNQDELGDPLRSSPVGPANNDDQSDSSQPATPTVDVGDE